VSETTRIPDDVARCVRRALAAALVAEIKRNPPESLREFFSTAGSPRGIDRSERPEAA
jgi:hypothetical protein